MISFLWAESNDHIIGLNGDLPWHLPADMKYFKETTTHQIIMAGRTTYESFKRPLPNRLNTVLTSHDKSEYPNDVVVFNELSEFLEFAKKFSDKEIFVVGGAKIFSELTEYVDRLYKTVIDYDFDGDTKMPEINYNDFNLVSTKEGILDDKNIYPHRFEVYERK
ncbi:MAG: dihydrofolate reductase [Apilactobacillus sp.]|uniref:dihydrofolate reductase n=1 Tax=Apilactobacillus TaxID=2767877 RepID=UPI0025EB7170|nr:dihydrofolate reductase [Apilactobacillus sp.]MCT6822404.1 dihydrofolate reductase [Apilactobacillus sp.]MCT6858614.1 dihydrofolate reductase [Apilactobacillus sp.]